MGKVNKLNRILSTFKKEMMQKNLLSVKKLRPVNGRKSYSPAGLQNSNGFRKNASGPVFYSPYSFPYSQYIINK